MCARKNNVPQRTPRDDGDATKAMIVEAAGHVFSERGYAETTNKEIAETGGFSVTSINYHFSSRDGLYEAVIRKVIERVLIDKGMLEPFSNKQLSAREKIAAFMEYIIIHDHQGWEIKLWAREVVDPSPTWIRLSINEAIPALADFIEAISEFTGIPVGQPELCMCFLSVFSPLLLMLMIDKSFLREQLPLPAFDLVDLKDTIRNFIFAGLEKTAKDFAKRSARPPE